MGKKHDSQYANFGWLQSLIFRRIYLVHIVKDTLQTNIVYSLLFAHAMIVEK